MHDFQQSAPNLDVRVSNLVGPFNLEHEGVDIALIHGSKDDWQDYYCEKLGTDEMVMVCHPSLVKKGTTVESLLAAYPAIYASNERRKNDWRYWCKAHQLPIPKQQKNLSFIVSVHAVQAAIRKLGVFITHKQFVKDNLSLGLLVEVGESVRHPNQDFYFACLPEKLKQESVLILRNWLRREFEPQKMM